MNADSVRKVLTAVAKLDTFASEVYGDPFCPFDCDWDKNNEHTADCPITIARDLLETTNA